MDHLVEEIGTKRNTPHGTIHICSSFGFGRRVVAPALSGLGAKYPGLQICFGYSRPVGRGRMAWANHPARMNVFR